MLPATSLGALRDVLDAAAQSPGSPSPAAVHGAGDRRGDARDLPDGAADLLDRGDRLRGSRPACSEICDEISSVALAVWLASDLTSEATTAKPRPASPARAASMVAFSASRLVCSAIAGDQLDHVADLLRGAG